MLSANKDWFHYDSYWRQWSRVLVRGGGEHDHQVEIKITPINDDWMEIHPGMIRRKDVRFGMKNERDIWTHNLPDEVYNKIRENLGKETADFFVHADILPMIDWFKYNQLSDDEKYIKFKDCQARFNWHFGFWSDPGNKDIGMDPKRKLSQYMDLDDDVNHITVGGVVGDTADFFTAIKVEFDNISKLISISMIYSTDKVHHSSHWTSRSSSAWGDDFIGHIDEMYKLDKLDINLHSGIKNMISATTTNLHVFNLNKE